MSNTIKLLYTKDYCCKKSERELYTIEMFAPFPEDPETEYDEEWCPIEKIPVVYSEDEMKTLELYRILNDIDRENETFSVEKIKHLIVSYQTSKANDENRIGCAFYISYLMC